VLLQAVEIRSDIVEWMAASVSLRRSHRAKKLARAPA
jgi:hypothetical protein